MPDWLPTIDLQPDLGSGLVFALVPILLLLFASAFFSGSETALTAASRARIHRLAQEGRWQAGIVSSLIENRERLIGAILLGNNIVNILASALATSIAIGLAGEAGVAYATIVMTTLVLIFAEVLPKTYAISNPVRVSLFVGPAINACVKLLSPIVATVQWIVRQTLRGFGIDIQAGQSILSAHEEIRGAIELHTHEGTMIKADRDMLGSILDLGDVEVKEVMVHRRNMVMIDADQPTGQIVEQVLQSPYTRIPLWRGDREHIIGILHAKDVLRAVNAYQGNFDELDIASIALEPWFVPETTTLREQLMAFRREGQRLATVVDEYGSVMGLVTLEDILEEIVGSLSARAGTTIPGVRPQDDGSLVVEGAVTIRDLNRVFDWSLPDDQAATIAGLVIHEARVIPEVGQVFSFYGFKFTILRRQRNQLTLIRIEPPLAEALRTADEAEA